MSDVTHKDFRISRNPLDKRPSETAPPVLIPQHEHITLRCSINLSDVHSHFRHAPNVIHAPHPQLTTT